MRHLKIKKRTTGGDRFFDFFYLLMMHINNENFNGEF